MNNIRPVSIFLPFLGVFLGYISCLITSILVEMGMPNKGVLGTITFPVAEELIKLFLVLIFLGFYGLTFEESIILGFMTGVGFRVFEMQIKTRSGPSFLLGSLGHGLWLCTSMKGYFRYRESGKLLELDPSCNTLSFWI